MTNKEPQLYIKGPDGITRGLDEHYDTTKDIEQDPYGAHKAIQDLWIERDKLREALKEVIQIDEKVLAKWDDVYNPNSLEVALCALFKCASVATAALGEEK
jgi:hypothetical protein